ncbi:M23 family metallopeptidase [Treponema pectinovorum]|uniref:M23 family metallopeptidase n=1 Tax=Treponema pectinovorum TaxID=164 RepID=UPI003D8D6C66
MIKKIFLFSLFFVFSFAIFSQKSEIQKQNSIEEKTKLEQVFSRYKVQLAYNKTIFPGDPIFVRLKLEAKNRKVKKIFLNEENPFDISIKLCEKFEDEKFTIDTDKEKAETAEKLKKKSKMIEKSVLYITDLQPKGKSALFLGAIPTSSYAEPDEYYIELCVNILGLEEEKLEFPILIESKDFIKETIHLDSKNTSIRTDSSKKRMDQIEILNKILFSKDEKSIFETQNFSYPTDATRRTSFFADRRIFQYSNGKTATSLHNGIDWGVPVGTKVFACGKGKVVLAEYRITTGYSIVIEHLPGLYSLYYHLSAIDVLKGQLVEKGAQIGLSGDTGLATGPHLHWEIRLNGSAVNPDWLVQNSW